LSLCTDVSNEQREKHITKTQVNHLARFATKAALFAVTKVLFLNYSIPRAMH